MSQTDEIRLHGKQTPRFIVCACCFIMFSPLTAFLLRWLPTRVWPHTLIKALDFGLNAGLLWAALGSFSLWIIKPSWGPQTEATLGCCELSEHIPHESVATFRTIISYISYHLHPSQFYVTLCTAAHQKWNLLVCKASFILKIAHSLDYPCVWLPPLLFCSALLDTSFIFCVTEKKTASGIALKSAAAPLVASSGRCSRSHTCCVLRYPNLAFHVRLLKKTRLDLYMIGRLFEIRGVG